MVFNIDIFKETQQEGSRYSNRLNYLENNASLNTECIKKAVESVEKNLKDGIRSFIIYGDPQSGKTEMMIALTAKLLDSGHKIIVVLLNDNVELLNQNLKRFTQSGIDPTPKKFTEIIDINVEIGNKEWIIFCKKNSSDLKKLISKISDIDYKVIIDDEGDYATPNAKINRNEQTKINELVGKLLGKNGIYIGVTATPARLDLNNTFKNANDRWIYFQPHNEYVGQEAFFPIKIEENLEYGLKLLPDEYDDPKYLREALFSFFINVAFLNIKVNKKEKNYCMLVHTSGKRVDHSEDYKQIIEILNILADRNHKNFEKYIKQIWEDTNEHFGSEQTANDLVKYIVDNVPRNKAVLINSDADKDNVEYATNPAALFTIAIGGNIISRGVTFENLLSMFFTRDVKHKIQQDTYIQRARMFGSRREYLKFFELTIPEKLYVDWHRCFIFHRLALESTKTGDAPVWLEDYRVRAVSPSSIDKTTVEMNSGEMGFEIFDYCKEIEEIINCNFNSLEKIRKLYEKLGDNKLPIYLINFIEHFSPDGMNSLAVHNSTDISYWGDVDKERILRPKGFIGVTAQEKDKYPHATHHIKVFFNSKNNKARVFYRYVSNIKFLKNLRNKI